MSVAGFDFGNENCVISIARRGGVDIVLNEVSNRSTPAVVGFNGKERFLGERGFAQLASNPKNTIINIKRFLGKKYNEAGIQEEIAKCPFRVQETANNGIGFVVRYDDKEHVLSPESIAAMMLTNLRQTAERENGSKLVDCCMAVPSYYNEHRRRALLDAAAIAGVNVLRLISEGCATAVAYGIFRDREIPEDKPIHVLFFDLGQSALQVTLASFVRGKMTILSQTSDENLGARDFDEYLYNHFAKEFLEKYKLDISTNARAQLRVRASCKALKKFLSANTLAPMNIECLMDDVDVSGQLTRDEFEAMAAPLLEKLLDPVRQALAEAQKTVEDLTSIEVVGGGSRIPCVVTKLTQFLGRDVNRTLNTEECIGKGCGIVGAMCSPAFKVKEYGVSDVSPFPVSIHWDRVQGEDGDTHMEVFSKNNNVPSTKQLTFYREGDFDLSVKFSENSAIPAGHPDLLGKFTVGNFPPLPPDEKTHKVRVKVRLNTNGCFSVESAQVMHEVEVEDEKKEEGKDKMDVEKKEGEAEAAPAAPATEAPAAAEGSAPMETDAQEPAKKKKKTKKIELTVSASQTAGFSATELQAACEAEFNMQLQDKLLAETMELRNNVEAYVYDIRGKANDKYFNFFTTEEREKLVKFCDETEDWLYEEGEDASKGVYKQRLEELQTMASSGVSRFQNYDNIPYSKTALMDRITHWKAQATSVEEKFAHIEQEERNKILKEISDIEAWLSTQEAAQEALAKNAAPILKFQDIDAKKAALDSMATPIMNKPKPKPKAPEPPKDEKKEGDEKKEEDAKMADEPPKAEEANPPPPAQEMDLD